VEKCRIRCLVRIEVGLGAENGIIYVHSVIKISNMVSIRGSNPKDFHNNMIDAFTCEYNWFRINLFSLNINETHCVQFKTKNKSTTDINIFCDNRPVITMSNKKFLGIHINDSMNWSCHVESIIPKLSSACYIMRSIKPYMPMNTMKTIYYSCFNTIMSYGLFLWGNLPHTLKIFRMQKKYN
jgi:hypothetical protein